MPRKTNAESAPRCRNCTLIGENPHPASYRGCSHAKGEEHNELPRDSLGGRSSLSSHHHSSPTQLHYVKTNNTSNHKQHQQSQTEQQYLPQKEFQKTDLSVQAPSSSNNDSVATSASNHDKAH
jgi:hypothetical protein